jgi:hypothetical protein
LVCPIQLELSKTLYSSDLRCNILSASKLAEHGIHGEWGKEMTLRTKNGLLFAKAELRDGLYWLDTTAVFPRNRDHVTTTLAAVEQPDLAAVASRGRFPSLAANIDFSDKVWTWPRRLGHFSLENMRRPLKVSTGMDEITDKQIQAKLGAVCPICATTRTLTKIPRESAKRRFERLGELIYVDIWEPYPRPGYNKVRYFLFTDSATKYTWAEPLKSRTEAVTKFMETHLAIERTHDNKIRRYRCDGELVRKTKLATWLREQGITIEDTVPYMHAAPIDNQPTTELAKHGPRRDNGNLARSVRVWQDLLRD